VASELSPKKIFAGSLRFQIAATLYREASCTQPLRQKSLVRLEALEASHPAAEQAACAKKTIAHVRHLIYSIVKERMAG